MKLKNAVVGAKVQVKERQKDSERAFYNRSVGLIGTIYNVDDDGDVWVRFDEGSDRDFGHHSQVRLVKESTDV